MALFVQLEDKKGIDTWHVVTSYEDETGGGSSLDLRRTYLTGCGQKVVAGGARMAEADGPPWTHRHVAKGCFTTAEDPQGD